MSVAAAAQVAFTEDILSLSSKFQVLGSMRGQPATPSDIYEMSKLQLSEDWPAWFGTPTRRSLPLGQGPISLQSPQEFAHRT